MDSSERSAASSGPHGQRAPIGSPDSRHTGGALNGSSRYRSGRSSRSGRGPSRPRLTAALLICAILACLQLPLAGIADIASTSGRLLQLWPQTALWAVVGLMWAAGTQQVYRWLRRSSSRADVFEGRVPIPPLSEDHRHVSAALWFGVGAVLCAVILPPMLVGQWTLQPVQLWQGLYGTYGMAGLIAAAGWLIHHCGFSLVVALALAAVQALAEAIAPWRWMAKVPVGGLVIGLVGAVFQAIPGGWAAAVTALIACTLLGAVHLLTGRRLRWTAPATAIVLIFL